MPNRRRVISQPDYINTVVFPATKDRVLKIAAAVCKKFSTGEIPENRIWDALIPDPDVVDLQMLFQWLQAHNSVTVQSDQLTNSLLWTRTSGRAGVIAQQLKVQFKLSVATYLVLDYFVPSLKDADLDDLFAKMYPLVSEKLGQGDVPGISESRNA
jgi:hypothetical protein